MSHLSATLLIFSSSSSSLFLKLCDHVGRLVRECLIIPFVHTVYPRTILASEGAIFSVRKTSSFIKIRTILVFNDFLLFNFFTTVVFDNIVPRIEGTINQNEILHLLWEHLPPPPSGLSENRQKLIYQNRLFFKLTNRYTISHLNTVKNHKQHTQSLN